MKTLHQIFIFLLFGFYLQTSSQTLSFTHSAIGGQVSFASSLYGDTLIWNYGDGTIDTLLYYNGSSHFYTTAGSYQVCLTLIDSVNITHFYCDSVITSCNTSFTYSLFGKDVSFNGQGYSNGTHIQYQWNYGDGSAFGAGKEPDHLYSNSGSYNVCLNMIDTIAGCSLTYCDSITLFPSSGCGAFFTYNVNYNAVYFNATPIARTNVGYMWRFGDGQQSNLYDSVGSSHTYNNLGSYQVCLNVYDSTFGCSDVYCDSISIDSFRPPNLQIGGNISLQNDTTSNHSYLVYLIKEDTSKGQGYIYAMDSVYSNRGYGFYNLSSSETYYTKATLLSTDSKYYNFFPTYYDKELLWINADSVVITPASPYTRADIELKAGVNPGGPGFIGGYISQGANFAPGDPLSGIQVLLFTGNDQPVAHILSDLNGRFAFDKLSYGDYKVYCDVFNKTPTPVHVKLDADNEKIDGVFFEIDSSGIDGWVDVGINDWQEFNNISMFPNPTSGRINIEFDILTEGEVLIYNSVGELFHYELLSKGASYQVTLPSDLPDGIYLVKFRNQEMELSKKILLNKSL